MSTACRLSYVSLMKTEKALRESEAETPMTTFFGRRIREDARHLIDHLIEAAIEVKPLLGEWSVESGHYEAGLVERKELDPLPGPASMNESRLIWSASGLMKPSRMASRCLLSSARMALRQAR
jgi:hypothetical protein